ncbi:MAG TPA: FHA domain-containing protein [Acidimicrobiales bacterium]|jgi:pSer/pThr/pTyr-binding forkhead associated (FHA) protein|nr:FHA domain-containing protein [Acidimicrobiales bacterium]
MPASLLAALKLVFLGLLYLFFLRVIRAVWVELREPKGVQVAVAPAPRATARAGAGFLGRPPRGPAANGAPRLVVLEPPALAGRAFDLGDELTVGRAVGCGVSLPDDTFVSTLHARVFRRDGGLYVEDLGSTNGTFVNDRPVNGTVKVRRGDRLHVGQTVMELEQ